MEASGPTLGGGGGGWGAEDGSEKDLLSSACLWERSDPKTGLTFGMLHEQRQPGSKERDAHGEGGTSHQ